MIILTAKLDCTVMCGVFESHFVDENIIDMVLP